MPNQPRLRHPLTVIVTSDTENHRRINYLLKSILFITLWHTKG